jgi:hypothetical protein
MKQQWRISSTVAFPLLDTLARCPYRRDMAQSILIFDFGTNEEAAQQARHKVDAWRQGFRLGNKMSLKFDRGELAAKAEDENGAAAKLASTERKASGRKSGAKAHDDKAEDAAHVRVLVKLDFSDHEKLSHQRWLDRIPTEEPFKSAEAETVRTGDAGLPETAEFFDSLD